MTTETSLRQPETTEERLTAIETHLQHRATREDVAASRVCMERALSEQSDRFHAALNAQAEKSREALREQADSFHAALKSQADNFHAAMNAQAEKFREDLREQADRRRAPS